jgi:hypothetical protein
MPKKQKKQSINQVITAFFISFGCHSTFFWGPKRLPGLCRHCHARNGPLDPNPCGCEASLSGLCRLLFAGFAGGFPPTNFAALPVW